jgi:DNA-binding MarR family transcriptional regulator
MKSRVEIEHLLDNSIGFMLNVTSRRTRSLLQKRLNAAGLDYGAWFFLRILWVEEGFTQRELCERTSLSQPTAALKKMLRDDLVRLEPDPDDRRSYHVFLTDKARAMKRQLLKLSEETRKKEIAGISERELKQVRDVLRRIRANCDSLD